jgi:DNA-binding CsgD family transcriptional regulator
MVENQTPPSGYQVQGHSSVADVDGLIVGRNDALGLLASFFKRVVTDGAALLVVGEPGVGKTALLDVAHRLAVEGDVQVLRGAGAQFEADVTYAGLNQILQPSFGAIDTLSALHRDALTVALGLGDGPPPQPLVVSNAALELLRQVSAVRPVAVIVDDLPWLDRPSAMVLGFVARRLSGSRIGFLAASRSGEAGFFEHADLPEFDVRPLDEDASTELVGARFPALADSVRQRLISEAEGNPLALLELPTVLTDPQRIAAAALPSTWPLSRRLHAVFSSRVSDLPTQTRVALLLAVLDATGRLEPILAVLGPTAIKDLAPAERAGLVEVEDGSGRLKFRHPLTRSAVVASSTSDQRRQAHTALAAVLADQPERRAWHLAEAALEPDEEVAAVLQQSAYRIRGRGDAVGAVMALVRAADLSPRAADRSGRLAEAAVIGATVTAEQPNVAELLTRAREADPDQRASLPAATAAAALLLYFRGEVDAAHRLLVAAVETWADRYDAGDSALVDALCHLFMVCWFGARPDLWEPFDAVVDNLGSRVPAIVDLWIAAFADPARAAPVVLGELDAAIVRLDDETDPTPVVRTSMAAAFTDRLSAMREPLWRLVSGGREGGAVGAAVTASFQLCLDDFVIGRWDEAEQLAREGIRICDGRDYQLPGHLLRYCQALICAGRGENETALALADELARWAAPVGVGMVEWYCCHIRALVAVGRGDFDEAYRQATAISPAGALGFRVPVALRVPMDLVEAAVRTGRHAEAAAHVAAMKEAGIAAVSPRLALLAAGSAAIAAADNEMSEKFDQALSIPGAGRYPFELARVQLVFGERLRRARSARAARDHLSAALGAFERLGARPWSSRAASELRAAGLAGRHSPELVSSALTAQERQIAELAAAGLTNRQIGERLFMSHRTVGAHLYNVFPKLGITSRAALRDALSPQSAKDDPQPG